MNRVFKNINIFLAQKIYFFLRKISKNLTYLTGISEVFRIIIWKFSIFMKPINPEKFSVNSRIWLRNLQWRRKEFFRGPGHLKAIKRPPQGVRGAKAPRTVAKFHFLKQFKVFENEFIFQKCHHFSSPKDPFFLRKNLENWTYFTRISEFFRKIILNFHFLWYPINPEKFSVNSNIWLRNFLKKLKNSLDGTIENGMKFLKFWRKSIGI